VCMDGYYNSEKYFVSIRQELLREIVLKQKSDSYIKLEKLIQETPNALIIHARRGDYLKSTGFTILDKTYYQKALSYFPKDIKIFAFSDDIDWLESVLDRDVYSVSGRGLEDFEELSLMAQGKNFIIANSTFSWWGAWLAQYENKKVIAPKKWFSSVLWWRANRDVVPKGWTRI
jgi:Glycosyl transferase family 11